jgi:3-phenylpropionate/trans-cinnamate dioxygenase ferredoxin subunit
MTNQVNSDYQKVAKATDVPEGEVKVFDLAGEAIAVCHVNGAFYAVQDLCTHDGGPLGEGEVTGTPSSPQIECPRHGARFDVKTGKAMCLPAIVDIPTYAVDVRGEDIFVKKSKS